MEHLKRAARITGPARTQLAQQLKHEYEERGVSIRALAEETQRSYGFIYTALREAGTTLRTRGGARSADAATCFPRASPPPTPEENAYYALLGKKVETLPAGADEERDSADHCHVYVLRYPHEDDRSCRFWGEEWVTTHFAVPTCDRHPNSGEGCHDLGEWILRAAERAPRRALTLSVAVSDGVYSTDSLDVHTGFEDRIAQPRARTGMANALAAIARDAHSMHVDILCEDGWHIGIWVFAVPGDESRCAPGGCSPATFRDSPP